jgi:3D (Asp-Asp-Asp) domain-containing protein
MYITYYYLSQESNYSGTANTTLYDKNCKAIVKVSSKFSDSACIEGSGRLKDGRVINYAKTCSCGRRCPTGGIICYSVLDKNKFPWGAGARSNPLRPLRSLAVDRNKIAIGTKLYIPEWDGVQIPAIDGIGGFTHDGCVYADDVGGAIKGNHFDFFSGTSKMWKALEKVHKTKKYLTVYKNPSRCP